jgi:hypothetical protein
MPAKPFVSELAQRLPVVDDTNYQHLIQPTVVIDGEPQSVTGYIPRDYEAQPLGSGVGAKLLPQALLDAYPDEKVWKERFKELEAKKMDIPSRLEAAFKAGEWLGLNQAPTNYCWCYGVIHAIMIQRLLAGEPFIRLSPYSVAWIVKGGRNQGGWGSQANAQCVKEGVADEKFWPMERPGMSSSERRSANMHAINNGRQYLAGSRANAALHKIVEYDDLPERSWAHKMAALCVPLPIASGYNRIGHERCTIAGIITSSGGLGAVDLDSYTGDGSADLKAYSQSFGSGEDMVIPRIATPSDT